MARRYFGTDGVRGLVGEDLTPELVGRLGKAVTLWAGRGARPRRTGHPSLRACARGGVRGRDRLGRRDGSARRRASDARRSRCSPSDLGAVVSASHNPPEYNGVKLFDREGRKLTDAEEEEIEALFGASERGRRRARGARGRGGELPPRMSSSASVPTSPACGSRVDCANGAMSEIAPAAFEQLGADVVAIGISPDGDEHQRRLRRDRPRRTPADGRRGAAATSASRSTATATGSSRSTSAASRSTATGSSRSSRSTSTSTSSRSRS